MNISATKYQAKQRKVEDELDIKSIILSFNKEAYTPERLERALAKAREYEANHRGSRGNRNVISACERLLNGLATA